MNLRELQNSWGIFYQTIETTGSLQHCDTKNQYASNIFYNLFHINTGQDVKFIIHLFYKNEGYW